MTYPTTGQGWNAPPPVPQGPQLSDHVGSLVWIKVNQYLHDYPFPFGVKDGIKVDFEVLQGRTEVGERQADVVLSNVVLVKQLKDAIGREFFGRIVEGRGSQANLPIQLGPPLAGDEVLINAFLARQAGHTAPAAQAAPAGPVPAETYAPAYGQQGPGNGQSPAYAQPGYPPQQQPTFAPPQAYPPQQPALPYGQPAPAAAPAGMPPASPPPRYSGNDDQPPF